ncbi:hypothetical protein D0C16_13035 [Cellvibrio sp. KY-GH-1]|uniref:hypothetical protein n=1 Tax=Cellvibrio sp. KY-GH-1 TaxID=2303332 RepID=UPI0012487FE2|nr:hypothetical protein [Cellvibrio sp. KY-GH-1]QEY16813.1 hypothetical protein D0C16_13035 [Cellvibrio sp. KY-GH-1]
MINQEITINPPDKTKYKIYIAISLLLLFVGFGLIFFGFDARSFLFFVASSAFLMVVGFSNLSRKISKLTIQSNILIVIKNGIVIFKRQITDIQRIEFYSGDEVFTLYDSRSVVIHLKSGDSFSFYVHPFTNDQIKLMCSWVEESRQISE